MNAPTFGSLFAGIGGIDLGLERAGWKCRWQVEYDPFCQAILRKHWPTIPIYGDIKQLDFASFERPDMLTGGFPCTPFSVAGKKKGAKDERWLWPEFARAIRILRPRLVLVENVPALVTFNREFGEVLGDLAACGYDAEWNMLRASDVGAPHKRERIFIVAYANSVRFDRFSGQRRSEAATEWQTPRIQERILCKSQTWEGSKDVADSKLFRFNGINRQLGRTQEKRGLLESEGHSWWAVEPNVGRVADGVPARVHRLRSLGNSCVPQISEWLGRRIIQTMIDLSISTVEGQRS